MKVFLKGAEIISVPALHAHLKQQLFFPGYNGENLGACWDCIRCVDAPLTVAWRDFAQSQAHLGYYPDQGRERLHAAEQEVPGFILEVR
jgi:RNAse (barnase) inhibitor barstar